MKVQIEFKHCDVPMPTWESLKLVAATCGYSTEALGAIIEAAYKGNAAKADLWQHLIDRTEREV